MPNIAQMLQHGTENLWLFIPSAILLGALHGLEPGHSKTMMAAFIIAIRGTVGQAVMLGLAATVSHTAIVWLVALAGLHFGGRWNAESSEPYFQIASALAIIAVALWMMARTWRIQHGGGHHHHDHDHQHEHHHEHEQDHRHGHEFETKYIDTGHGVILLDIFEEGVPPRFHIHGEGKPRASWAHHKVTVETERPDGSRQQFTFTERDGFLESNEPIPEPHEFVARLHLAHGHHSHDFDVEFTEAGHAHALEEYSAFDLTSPGYKDPHELAHANDIRRRFAHTHVTTGQIIAFGLTGGLIPCPASITVLLICLQLKKVGLGVTLVLCFSIGLALTMVASGVLAALSVRHVSKRFSGFGEIARKAPYFSGVIILAVGFAIGLQGLHALR